MCNCEEEEHPGLSCGSAGCFCHIGEKEQEDTVNHPKHYTSHPSGFECIEVVRHMGFNLGNVIKYIWRDGLKDTETPLEDLKKAAWYLNDEIMKREEG